MMNDLNVSFAAGALVGILLVILFALWKKRRGTEPRYDERQVVARAKAAQLALGVLAALMLVNGFVREILQTAWAGPFLEAGTLLMVAATVYGLRCVWTDAYFSLRERPKTWARIFAVMMVLNAALGIVAIVDGDVLEDGLLTYRAANLMIAAMFVALLIAVALKRRKDRREEAET